jgi:hypothetical protein
MTGIITRPINIGYYEPGPDGTPSIPGTLLTDREVASRLNVALGWLVANREKLQAMGFPEPIAEAGERWDGFAVWQWQQAMAHMKRSLPSREVTELRDAIAEAKRKFGSGKEG